MTARVRVLVGTVTGDLTLLDDRPLAAGMPVLFGREGDIGVGVSPVDPKVSRQAIRVTRTGPGWQVAVNNRNGVIVHPWGQAAGRAQPESLLPWPRVALRVVGRPDLRHWVLLEDAALAEPPARVAPGTDLTESAGRPRPLTAAQEHTVRTLFAELLAWPPVIPATPRQLKQVASRLGATKESIQRRLEEVRKKAVAVGLARNALLTDPEYLYVLVRAGYLTPREEDLHPLLRTPPARW